MLKPKILVNIRGYKPSKNSKKIEFIDSLFLGSGAKTVLV
ncbi:hypothetical protein J2S10_003020 [Neobacillus ginsengisoli]|uniref:Uncharacterized protein n=1 Tax=Neobacillus ginsengisoli TaxID=904295 RepID=A0ABT9XW95_9BACI|nr:hypothetical protein [Neobacillus ginsengisoli]